MTNEVREISTCEVCGNKRLESVLNLGLHPLCDDLVPVDDSRVTNGIRVNEFADPGGLTHAVQPGNSAFNVEEHQR